MSDDEDKEDKDVIAAEKEALNLKLPPIMYPPEEIGADTPLQSKLLKFRRVKEQGKRLNQIITVGAIKKHMRISEEKKKRSPIAPEPEYPSTMYSDLRRRGENYIFMKKRVESHPIVPIQREWLDNMLKLVPQSLKNGREREQLVENLLNEVTTEFERSMKRYLVRTVLVRPPVSWLEDEGGPLPESPLGLDYSKPWHSNYVQARSQVSENLHVLHPTLRTLLDLGYTTFANRLLLDLTGFRAKGPMDCESLRNDVSINARKTEEKLMNTWYPKVINIFTKKEAHDDIKAEKLDSFYNCVSTLMSNQLRDLLKRTVEGFVNLFDPNDNKWLPIFKMELTFDDEKMDFYPTFQDLQEVVGGVVDWIGETLKNVQTVQSWLAGGPTTVKLNTDLPDHMLDQAFRTLREAVNLNLQGPKEHFNEYVEKYSWLINGTAVDQIQTFQAEDHTFDEYTEYLHRI
uniref:Dynein heavy chain 12, axonemal isoform X15 n=1 Tax=Phascolarctos cinereus TaxID=38626 RepID=A0A6P5IR97_PHACI|nr:dynein heavy chain 12, axonemal isoform X15 [Phascolarctos cinereus]